jgi:hypothetical protein
MIKQHHRNGVGKAEAHIAKRDAMDPLSTRRFDRVADAIPPAAILEAGRDMPRLIWQAASRKKRRSGVNAGMSPPDAWTNAQDRRSNELDIRRAGIDT